MSGFAEWPRLELPARRVLLDAALERLPEWLELADADAEVPRLVDRRHGDGWRLFAGGPVMLGATAERQAAIDALLAFRADRGWLPDVYLPVREVTVAPFLLAERVLYEDDEPRYFVHEVAREAAAAVEARGARLPGEAEWELAWYAMRGDASWLVGEHELCADGWRPTLEALGGEWAVVPGGPSVVRRASAAAGELEYAVPARLPLASVRIACVRPALDVPYLPP